MDNQLQLLNTKRFLPLFVTQFFGAFNDNLFKNALVVLITYKLAATTKQNAQILVVVAAGLFILPMVLFAATAGQCADKFEKSRLIVKIKFIEVVLMLFAGLAFYLESIPGLLTVLFLMGAQSCFFGPLKYSILPEHLTDNELVSGNALIEAATFISILLGTIGGSVLILQTNGSLIITIALMFFAILGLIASMNIPTAPCYNASLKVEINMLRATINLLGLVTKKKVIFRAIMGISWFWLLGATYVAQFPTYGKDILNANANVVALLLTTFSIGIGVGSMLCNKFLKGKIEATIVPIGGIGMAIFGIDLYFASKYVVTLESGHLMGVTEFVQYLPNIHILSALFMIAFFGGLYIVPLYAILQHTASNNQRGRYIACNNIYNALFMAIAAGITVLLLKLHFSINEIFLIVSIASTIVAVYICKLLPFETIQAILRLLLLFIYRVEVINSENLYHKHNSCIVIANHTSLLDGILLAAFYPKRLTIAINSTWAKTWPMRLALYFLNLKPLDPTNPMAIKSLVSDLKNDQHILIFPEGRVTRTGSLMKVYEGPGLIASKANVPILPIQITGAIFSNFSYLKGKLKVKLFPKIRLHALPLEYIKIPTETSARERRKLISDRLYTIMVNMAFASSPYKKTLWNSLKDASCVYGKKLPIVEDVTRNSLDYKNLITKSQIFACHLQPLTEEQNVGILMPNSIAACVLFFALQYLGKVAAVLNISAGSSAILSAINTGQIKQIFTSNKFIAAAKLENLITEIKNAGVTVYYLEEVHAKIGIKAWITAKYHNIFTPKFIKTQQPNNPAVLLFTSGSEGTPKGVLLSHTNIQANRYQLSSVVDFNSSDVVLNALPMFHSFGLTAGTVLPILSGIKTFLYPSPLHYRIIPEVAYDINATIMFGTNTFLNNYAKYAHPYDFYSIRYIFAGAEKLQPENRALWIAKFGVRIFEGYGTTETAPAIATNTPMYHKEGTVGKFLPGIKYKLQEVPGIDSGGKLMVAGPNVMLGYILAANPGKLIPPDDNWYDTGDIVNIAADGFIQIQGRAKRFAKIAGEMISLTAVEALLQELWPENQHAVINIPCPKKGEALVLFTTKENATSQEISHFAREKGLSELAVPKTINWLKQLPLLGSGKTDYAQLHTTITTTANG